ncbi:MAG: glycosyltransferase family 4 protein [Christensenellales bacterium]|jgi:glycosyltransferase involved in cell wall biosynthesis
MRILHINSYLRASPFYDNLFRCERELGADVRAYVPLDVPYTGEKFENCDFARVCGKYDRFLFHYKHNKILKDALSRYDGKSFDLLHAHSLFSNGYVAMRLSEAWNIPYIVAVRDTDVNIFFKWQPHLRALGRRILKNAQKVVFISPSYRENALKPYLSNAEFDAVMQKSAVLPNGVDDLWMQNIGQPKAREKGAPVKLLFVGAMIPRKNVPSVVRAANVLKDRGHDVKLTVLGKPVDERVVKLVDADPLCERLPPRPMRELLPVYREHDIFVMPSKRETFGIVYVEAMSQGLPVLYTKGQGFDGQLPEGECGFAVLPTDAEDIADKAERILQNYETLSQNAVLMCRAFNWRDIAKEYLAIYETILSSR